MNLCPKPFLYSIFCLHVFSLITEILQAKLFTFFSKSGLIHVHDISREDAFSIKAYSISVFFFLNESMLWASNGIASLKSSLSGHNSRSGPSCSKLTMSLVNVSLKL